MDSSRFAKMAYQLMAERDYKTILDLGCGNGRDSLYFASKGLKVTALDWSEVALDALAKQAKKLSLLERINVIWQNIANLELPDNSFDVIFANLSLHYFDDQTTRKIIDQVYKILRNRGLLFIEVKSDKDPLSKKGQDLGNEMRNVYGTKRRFFSQSSLLSFLSNFRVVKISQPTAFLPSLSAGKSYMASFIEVIAEKR